MRTLNLTTRHRSGSFESDACLLVFDAADVSSSVIGDEVRDVLERRPTTTHIYVLAPFKTDDELLKELELGSAVERAGADFDSRKVEVLALGLRTIDHALTVQSKRFGTRNNAIVSGDWESLPQTLREGWLFALFDRYDGLVDAPVGVHFSKASGKHSSKFLRTSSVLLSSAATGMLAFFTFAEAKYIEPRRVFVDTAPLLSVAFAMQRVASVRGLWTGAPPASSFSSYGGIGHLPRLGAGDLVLVSASTSGSLVARLVELGVAEQSVVTLYFLHSQAKSKTAGGVLCDLTHAPERPFGYPLVENYPASTCEFCKKGYVLAELEGDQFLLERRSVKRLRITKKSQADDASKALEELAREGIFSVRPFLRDSRRTDVDFEIAPLLVRDSQRKGRFIRALNRHTPAPLDLVVASGGITPEQAKQLLGDAGLAELAGKASVIAAEGLSQLTPQERANVLVLVGFLSDHSQLREINAQLRTKASGGCVAYLSMLTIAESARNLTDLKTFLTFGELGPDTFTFRSAVELMLPTHAEEKSAWQQELDLLNQLSSRQNFPDDLQTRLSVLQNASSLSADLFFPGHAAELRIARDWVLLDTKSRIELISQADVYTVVSNAIAAVRCNDVPLTASSQRGQPSPVWGQSVYSQSVLCPSNFRDFNDAILRASFLRAANVQELNYTVDEACSEEMRDVILADIESWGTGQADALPEFFISMACRRLRLLQKHVATIKHRAAQTQLPASLQVLLTCLA